MKRYKVARFVVGIYNAAWPTNYQIVVDVPHDLITAMKAKDRPGLIAREIAVHVEGVELALRNKRWATIMVDE